MTPAIRMLVGIPASGKSSVARHWLATGEIDVLLESDAYRAWLTGDAGDVSRDAEMWPHFYRALHGWLRNGGRVAVDCTHVQPEDRQKIKDAADAYGVIPEAWLVPVRWDTALDRNRWRDRYVPGFVMDRMWRDWVAYCSPAKIAAEGFRVYEVDQAYVENARQTP